MDHGRGAAAGGNQVSTSTSMGNDVLRGGGADDTMSGDYGNDVLRGGQGTDELDGGRGNDKLRGGTGDDVINSLSDGGEGAIAQDISNTDIDAASRRIYPNQAGLPADDVLTGAAGADEFRFQTLINAKEDILRKHADANGVIDYAGVAGENNNVHDHWVDGIGNDVITDFNAAVRASWRQAAA
jgi:trimeric autotransporter adhesin